MGQFLQNLQFGEFFDRMIFYEKKKSIVGSIDPATALEWPQHCVKTIPHPTHIVASNTLFAHQYKIKAKYLRKT